MHYTLSKLRQDYFKIIAESIYKNNGVIYPNCNAEFNILKILSRRFIETFWDFNISVCFLKISFKNLSAQIRKETDPMVSAC